MQLPRYIYGMDAEIRAEVIEVFKAYVTQTDVGIVNLIQQRPQYREKAKEIYRTVHWMKDIGELVSTDNDRLRLSYSFIESQAPWIARWKKYLVTNWIAILGAVTGVGGFVISLVALFRH